MRVPQANAEQQLDRFIERALRAEPYPTAVQRADGRASVRAGAVAQAILPALRPASQPRLLRAGRYVRLALDAIWSARSVLLEETAFRRARSGDVVRATAWARAPYVQFQPMW